MCDKWLVVAVGFISLCDVRSTTNYYIEQSTLPLATIAAQQKEDEENMAASPPMVHEETTVGQQAKSSR